MQVVGKNSRGCHCTAVLHILHLAGAGDIREGVLLELHHPPLSLSPHKRCHHRNLQRLYCKSPSTCVRRLLTDQPPVYCSIPDEDLVSHFTTSYAAAPALAPPSWLFDRRMPDPRDGQVEGDVLDEAFTPEETLIQLKRAKMSAPGIDHIIYANWRWVDPLGLILTAIFNICRVNARVPSEWKHATVRYYTRGVTQTPYRTGAQSAYNSPCTSCTRQCLPIASLAGQQTPLPSLHPRKDS